jgi:ParB family chromosome partitioning protein
MSGGRLGNLELTKAVSTEAIALAHDRARGEALRAVPVDTLARSPWQPRTRVDRQSEDFAGLVESIRSRGVLEPLLARARPDGSLELLAGERRLEASKAAGLATVPVRVLVGLDDTDAREVALVENLARQDLTAWEEAQALAALAHALEAAGRAVSVRKLAHLAGRSKSAVDRALRIAAGCTTEVRAAAEKLVAKLAKGATVPAWDTLPANTLEEIAKGDSVADRARLYHILAARYAPADSSPTARPRTKAAGPPVTLRGDLEAGTVWSLTLRAPPAKLSKADARTTLAALEPLVRALRARLK